MLGIPSGSVFFLVVPEDVPAGFAAIYGFAPPITKGNDHRFGFGFRLGNHADLQILYEFGPQTVTRPLQPPKIRSTSYRQRFVRRRPVLELLVRAGVIKRTSYDFNLIQDCDDEPR
ncbi:hypothetical protein PYW08_010894 [Mythimna loreyi]|uniref:Uncharacterized protein n=1 Tax=Mythimna loreyi TaxID=667449 RepID=A0ACC2Q219_9NEOP|nr:hypothetical protein PYW08_010894 [Mythimna loreyi]